MKYDIEWYITDIYILGVNIFMITYKQLSKMFNI